MRSSNSRYDVTILEHWQAIHLFLLEHDLMEDNLGHCVCIRYRDLSRVQKVSVSFPPCLSFSSNLSMETPEELAADMAMMLRWKNVMQVNTLRKLDTFTPELILVCTVC